jgi:hypothetical protein
MPDYRVAPLGLLVEKSIRPAQYVAIGFSARKPMTADRLYGRSAARPAGNGSVFELTNGF